MRTWIALIVLAGCKPADDVTKTDETDTNTPTGTDTDTPPDTDTATEPTGEPSIEGQWRSAGADISPLFQTEFFQYVRIDADFLGDGSYTVEAENADGAVISFTGTYTTDTATDPATIVLSQLTPAEATAEGIWAVAGDTLTYEVVQTVPDIGASPPTPAGGFGSTASPGLTEGDNVQIYVRR